MSSAQHGLEAITIGTSQKITLTGGGAAAVIGGAEKAGIVQFVNGTGSLDIAGMCALGGLVLAILGFLTSFYFQWRCDRRETQEFYRRAGEEAHARVPEHIRARFAAVSHQWKHYLMERGFGLKRI